MFLEILLKTTNTQINSGPAGLIERTIS